VTDDRDAEPTPEEQDESLEDDAAMEGDLSALTAEEVRRRSEAPLPPSLTEFLE
jgi:hypothetical protein